jgi:hypothetical protein
LLARFTELRKLTTERAWIHMDQPASPLGRFEQLELDDTRLIDETGEECNLDLARSFLCPAQLPALRQLDFDHIALGGHPSRFDLLLPQLSDIQFTNIPLSLVATRLPHCTSLKTLSLMVDWIEDPTHLLAFFNSLRKLHLEEFRYWDWSDTNGEVCLDNVRRVMAIVGEMKTLRKLSLRIDMINTNIVTRKKWIEFKQGVKKICEKNKVEIVRVFQEDDINELIWVD